MTPRSRFGAVVPRLCRVRTQSDSDEDPFPLDDDGFLSPWAPVAGATDEIARGAILEPAMAASGGALVLLGEPGAGKTTVFEELTRGRVRLLMARTVRPCCGLTRSG